MLSMSEYACVKGGEEKIVRPGGEPEKLPLGVFDVLESVFAEIVKGGANGVAHGILATGCGRPG